MIKTVLKQIGASKRANAWIFIQLLVIFVASWLVLDPIYTIVYQQNMFDEGFEPERMYVLRVKNIQSTGDEEVPEESDDVVMNDFNTLLQLVKSNPEIIAVSPQNRQFVYSGSMYSRDFMNPADTARKSYAQLFFYYKGTDYFKTFRFRDARTGRYDQLDSIPYAPNRIFITQSMEEMLFGKGNGIGKEVCPAYRPDRNKRYKVAGVLKDIKANTKGQSLPFTIFMEDMYTVPEDADDYFVTCLKEDDCSILFRINDRTDETLFIEKFKKEWLPKLTAGNFCISDISSMEALRKESIQDAGIFTTLTVQGTLALFFMINITLAVFATFWLRIRKRKSDIGIMIALGSTKKEIKYHFLLESLSLFALSVLAGTFVLIQIVYFKGVYALNNTQEAQKMTSTYLSGWPVNNEAAHFLIVTVLTIVIIGTTVLLATWIPASRAAKTQPAQALKDE